VISTLSLDRHDLSTGTSFVSGSASVLAKVVVPAVVGPRTKAVFKYKKGEWLNRLKSLDRDGQFLSENGQIVVFDGQKCLAILVE
jgi:hypothetical protein